MVGFKQMALQGVFAAVGALATIYTYFVVVDDDDARVGRELDTRAEWRSTDLAWKIDRVAAPVMTLAAMQALNPSESRPIVDMAQVSQLSGIDLLRIVGWQPRVSADERAAFEREMRAAGYTDFEIREPAGNGRFASAPQRAEYFPISFGWVLDGPTQSYGINVAFNAQRAMAFDKARDSGVATLSDPILSTATKQYSIFYIVPVYRDGIVPPGVEERREKLRGYMVGVSEVSRLLNRALDDTPLPSADIYIAAEDEPSDRELKPFARYGPAVGRFETAAGTVDVSALKGRVVTHRMNVVNRTWTVVSNFSPAAIAAERVPGLWGILVAGFAVTGLIMIVFYRETLEVRRAESAVAKATTELRRSGAFVRTVLDGARDAVVSIDDHGTIIVVNAAIEGVFGYTADELIGQNINLLMPESQRADHDAYLKSYRETGIQKIIGVGRVVDGRRKDGTLIPVDLTVTEMVVGDVRGYVGTMRDLTAQKKMEAQLVQAQKMEAVGQLTGGVAHDFNNLLGVIVGNLDMVENGLETQPELKVFVQRALAAADSGAALTQRLLAFSRRQVLQPDVVDVAHLVSETARLYQRTLGETIEVRTEIAEDLWNCRADPAQLETALLNLAINARDAMPDGGGLIIAADNAVWDVADAALDPGIEPGEYVRLAISDTGTGMEAAIAERVFEPFFTTKEVGKGSGLGLSMVFGFVQQSGGHVRIYSELGHGTTVRLYLPRAPTVDTGPAPAKLAKLPSGGGRKILVVEDNAQMREVSIAMLSSLGYEPLAAGTGDEALAVLGATPGIEILFTDIVLAGGTNGIELTAEARRRHPGLKVLYTSGFPNIDRAALANPTGEIDILTKPFRAVELAKRLADV